MVNGEVVTGPEGQPPEIGAICLQPEAPVNYSGIPGTFEHLACASGLVNLYVSQGGRRERGMSPPDIFEAAARGDQAASAAVDRFGRYIAQALGVMINILNPDACLLGGGISGAGRAVAGGCTDPPALLHLAQPLPQDPGHSGRARKQRGVDRSSGHRGQESVSSF